MAYSGGSSEDLNSEFSDWGSDLEQMRELYLNSRDSISPNNQLDTTLDTLMYIDKTSKHTKVRDELEILTKNFVRKIKILKLYIPLVDFPMNIEAIRRQIKEQFETLRSAHKDFISQNQDLQRDSEDFESRLLQELINLEKVYEQVLEEKNYGQDNFQGELKVQKSYQDIYSEVERQKMEDLKQLKTNYFPISQYMVHVRVQDAKTIQRLYQENDLLKKQVKRLNNCIKEQNGVFQVNQNQETAITYGFYEKRNQELKKQKQQMQQFRIRRAQMQRILKKKNLDLQELKDQIKRFQNKAIQMQNAFRRKDTQIQKIKNEIKQYELRETSMLNRQMKNQKKFKQCCQTFQRRERQMQNNLKRKEKQLQKIREETKQILLRQTQLISSLSKKEYELQMYKHNESETLKTINNMSDEAIIKQQIIQDLKARLKQAVNNAQFLIIKVKQIQYDLTQERIQNKKLRQVQKKYLNQMAARN